MSSQVKVLVAEDEEGIRTGLVATLNLEGYLPLACSSGDQALDLFKSEKPDLVILDLMMPGVGGLEVCKSLRAISPNLPIIILTAKDTAIDKIIGLELGADDYVTKPYEPRELLARIKAILRRISPAADPVAASESQKKEELVFADVLIDFKTYRAKKGEAELILSAKEFELIRFLSNQPDVPVSRNDLLDQVWGYNSYPTTRTVDNFIARLRQKVEDIPDKPRHIITVHGVGYKFVLAP